MIEPQIYELARYPGKVDRRTFALSMAAIAAPAETAAKAAASRTFSIIGKEERPFQGHKEATLASHDGQGYLAHMWFGGSFPDYAKIRVRVYVDHEQTASISMELGWAPGSAFKIPMLLGVMISQARRAALAGSLTSTELPSLRTFA